MYVAMTCYFISITQPQAHSCVSGTWSLSCVGAGSHLQARNSRNIDLSSTEDKLHNNHDPNIQLIEEYVNVCMGLVEG